MRLAEAGRGRAAPCGGVYQDFPGHQGESKLPDAPSDNMQAMDRKRTPHFICAVNVLSLPRMVLLSRKNLKQTSGVAFTT